MWKTSWQLIQWVIQYAKHDIYPVVEILGIFISQKEAERSDLLTNLVHHRSKLVEWMRIDLLNVSTQVETIVCLEKLCTVGLVEHWNIWFLPGDPKSPV